MEVAWYPDKKEKAPKIVLFSEAGVIRHFFGSIIPRQVASQQRPASVSSNKVKHSKSILLVKRMALLSFKLLNLFPPYSKVLFCQKKGTGSTLD